MSHGGNTGRHAALARNAGSRGTRRDAQTFEAGAGRGFEQGRRRNLQRSGQNEQCVEGGIGRPGLATGHVGAKETCVVSELFLGHAAGRAQLFDAQSEGHTGGQSFHTMMMVRTHLFVHTLSRTCDAYGVARLPLAVVTSVFVGES